jgi:hypothetical protein
VVATTTFVAVLEELLEIVVTGCID